MGDISENNEDDEEQELVIDEEFQHRFPDNNESYDKNKKSSKFISSEKYRKIDFSDEGEL